jgi:Rieske Fe-S protein
MGALRLGDQSQFHARKYVLSLAQVAHGDGCRVHEGSRVLELEKDETYVLRTDAGEVEADYVVLATGAPITMEGLFFARAHAWQHYAVAAPVNKDALQGSWIGAGTPVRSLRTAPLDASRRLLIVVGESHKVGQSDDTTRPYAALAGFLARNFSGAEITHRWSAHDQFSVDRLPYIGRTGAPDSRLFVATGFGGWGLTNGTIAAFVIRDAILGRSNDWSELFDPNRSTLVRAPGALVRENVNVAKQLVGGKLRGRDTDVESLEAGDGAVVDLDGQRVAAYRDESGGLRTVSATCTHMGCVVEWNEAEKTWDCPCHGSRFGTDGAVLHGPATHPLEAVAFAEDRTRAPLS